jgi:tetratricopeptide (TPR) repeat protein
VIVTNSKAFCQRSELDSLLSLLKSHQRDTNKVLVYSRLSELYSDSHTQDSIAIEYADSCRLLSEALGFKAGIALANSCYANVDQFEGNYYAALNHLEQALLFYQQKGDSTNMVKVLFEIGKAYKSLGEFDKSLENLYGSVRICELKVDKVGLAKALNSVGSIYRLMKRYKEAIANLSQANELYKELGMTKNYAMGLQNLGNVYGSISSYDTAIQLYNHALESIQKLGLKLEEAIILGNLGGSYDRLNQ